MDDTGPSKNDTAKPEEAAESEAPETPEPEVSAEDDAEARVAALEAEAAELKDQLLRALAEAENARRRAQRDRDEAARYAAAPLSKDLLSVSDNLDRALEAAPEEAEGPAAALRAGVEMTRRELAKAFEKHGILRLDPMGEKLDPHRHEALFEMPHDTVPAGHVAQVLEPGFVLNDRLLRPARVGVSSGAPAAAPETPEAPEDRAPGSHVDTKA